MKNKKINSLQKLNEEIERLQTEAGYVESRMDEQFIHLKDNFGSICLNSFCKSGKKGSKNGHSFFGKDPKAESFWDKIADRFSNRFEDGIDNLLDRVFSKKK